MTHTVLNGDALAMLRTLPDQSVHCCVTSPPYWGLRDYGTGDAQIGLEDTPDAYVARLVAVFDEVRRVLRDDGTLWLNLGDSYAGSWGNYSPTGTGGQRDKQTERFDRPAYNDTAWRPPTSNANTGLKPKDLVGIPWRVAFALQAAGWWLRSDIIWAKPNPMPESVTDRPTKAHEYVFLLSKAERYYYDAEAVREPMAESSMQRINQENFWNQTGGEKDYRNGTNPNRSMRNTLENFAQSGITGRNKRSVWTISTRPYPEAHFAVFPPALVEPCILAGTSAHGVCPACGAPWVRVVDVKREKDPTRHTGRSAVGNSDRNDGDWDRMITTTTTTGWDPSCSCDAGDPIPATVLDPFAGSGTTLAVAIEHKRAAIGIELNPDYVTLIDKRLAGVQPRLFNL